MKALVERLRSMWRLGDDVVGINARNIELVLEGNPRAEARKVDDKLVTKRRLAELGVPVPRTLARYDSLRDVDRLAGDIEPLDGFVVKPVVGSGGTGILVVRREGDGCWSRPSAGRWVSISREQIATHLRELLSGMLGSSDRVGGRAYLEELLVAHPFCAPLTVGGLPDLRVLVRDGQVLMAMLRLPTSRSGGRANLHQGAIGVGVDLDSGLTHGAVLDGRSVESHPDTGAALIGAQLPEWQRMLEISLRAADAFDLRFVGVDLILDARHGPLVIELNARPGVAIQLANRRGLREALDR